MPLIVFAVPFVAGKQRPRVLRSGRTYTPKQTREAESAIAEAYRKASKRRYGSVLVAPEHEPVTVLVITERPLPASRPKSLHVEADTYKPDWDNVGKLCDALNRIAWHDDAQITAACVIKRPRRRGSDKSTTITVSWGDERALLSVDGERLKS